LVEPFASVLTEDSLLNRFGEYACGWKGCGAMLSSENNLAKHVRMREHVLQGVFTVGVSTGREENRGEGVSAEPQPWSAAVLYRCLWEGCDHPCFNSVQDIMQHMAAVHISKVLRCPYGSELARTEA
jgi:hypothetical protein